MTTTSTTVPLPRHWLRLARKGGMRFVILYEWVAKLALKPAVALTYAVIMSLTSARMRTRIRDIVGFAQRSPRSVRRHVVELEAAGLIVRRARYVGRMQTENGYDLLWVPGMPPELKGGPYDSGVRVAADAGDLAPADVLDRSPRSPASEQFRNAARSGEQAGKSEPGGDECLPPALRRALEKAAPGQWDDCIRVLRATCDDVEPLVARRVQLIALNKLIRRCERGMVNNPAGLLRNCIFDEAMKEYHPLTAACAELRSTIARGDHCLHQARSGFEMIRRLRKRALDVRNYVTQHEAAFGERPHDVPTLAVQDGAMSEVLSEVGRLLEELRSVREAEDAVAAARIEEGLNRLERTLDELLRGRRGQAS